jgi:hypothetical protein
MRNLKKLKTDSSMKNANTIDETIWGKTIE